MFNQVKAQVYLDLAGVMFVVLTPDERVELINRKGCEILGYSEEEVLGQNWFDRFIPENRRSEVRAVFYEIVKGNLAPVERYENPVLTRSGAQRLVAWHSGYVRSPSGEISAIVASGEDITEKRQLEEELRRTQRMEAMERVAGDAAHDLKNLLATIRINTEILRSEFGGEHRLQDHLRRLTKASHSADNLVRQLLAFSRRQALEPQIVNLSSIVQDMLEMLQGLVGKSIEIEADLEPRLDSVAIDRGQIEQVLMNLVLNARDAMLHGGRLRIETANVELSVEETKKHPERIPGRYAALTVVDSGAGMSDQILDRIFEPFYTTKKNGTGLGLSTVHGIVKQSRGLVKVRSQEGSGTTFQILLPCCDTQSTSL